jgi:hypothetical protein
MGVRSPTRIATRNGIAIAAKNLSTRFATDIRRRAACTREQGHPMNAGREAGRHAASGPGVQSGGATSPATGLTWSSPRPPAS